MDLAIGVVIGGAFGHIVTSLVADVIMPLVGMVAGKVQFTTLKVGPVAIGNFIQATIDFLIVSLVIFLAVKAINKFKKHEEKKEEIKKEAESSNEEKLLVEIRDLLKK